MNEFLQAISGSANSTVVGWVVFFMSIALMVLAIGLTVSVLMQSSKDHKLSGAISGGADTFFGKTKGNTMDKVFSKVTIVGSIVFVVIVMVLYVMLNWANLGNL